MTNLKPTTMESGDKTKIWEKQTHISRNGKNASQLILNRNRRKVAVTNKFQINNLVGKFIAK